MLQFIDTGDGYGRLFGRDGTAVHTTRHLPRQKRLIGFRWPEVVTYRKRIFADAGRYDGDGFRCYCEVPEILGWDE